jgi:hypothetical protein
MPSETADDLGFAPIGRDEPYRVFMTRDPLGEAGDVNLYRAMRNNPVNFVDPLGLCPFGWKADESTGELARTGSAQ